MNKAFLSAVCLILGLVSAGFLAAECTATDGEHLDANYKPEAPMRSSVGSGYVLTGTVRASGDCKPIPGATVELWLAGPGGYGDNYTGTVVADKAGHYRFQPLPVSFHGAAASHPHEDSRGRLPAHPDGMLSAHRHRDGSLRHRAGARRLGAAALGPLPRGTPVVPASAPRDS